MGLQILVPTNFGVGPTGSLIDFAFAPPSGAPFVDSLTFDDQGCRPCSHPPGSHAATQSPSATPRKTADPANKSSKKRTTSASKLQAQHEEHARRSAERSLCIQDMELRYRQGTTVHFWMSDVSCECGQTATCERISVLLFSRGMATICYNTVSMATRTVIIWRVFLCLQGAIVALDDWCAWLHL